MINELSRRAAGASGSVEVVMPTRMRQVRDLESTADCLEAALAAPEGELAAEHLRRSSSGLARLGGSVDTEGLLDRIFSRFCIGK